MNIFFYCIIFIIGILFGSFYTLAVHRIPKKEDITHTHSYCPNCNNKLGFFELIPVLSYIFLGGKCKHCGKKIRIRYLLLELFSGATFVLLALGINLNIYDLKPASIAFFVFATLYLTFVFLIAGIDKESRNINKSVLYYGIIISILYIVYLYIIEKFSIYRYVMYLASFLILLLLDNSYTNKHKKDSYTIGILFLVVIMAVFTGEYVAISTIGVTLCALAIYIILKHMKNKSQNISNNLKIGYFMCCVNVIVFLSTLYMFKS